MLHEIVANGVAIWHHGQGQQARVLVEIGIVQQTSQTLEFFCVSRVIAQTNRFHEQLLFGVDVADVD